MIFQSAIHSIITRNLRNKLTKNEINETLLAPILKEIRTALLNADVNLKVIRQFLANIKDEALAVKQLTFNQTLDQVLINIVHQNLIQILGKQESQLKTDRHPTNIMLVGLNGSGKTTTCAKLAYYLKNKFQKEVNLIALDVYRPAAIDQLAILAQQVQAGFYHEANHQKPITIAHNFINHQKSKHNVINIFDTAGRMQTDELLMQELVQIKKVVNPDEILFVADGMSGQEILPVCQTFHQKLNLTGVIITKSDSEAKLGAALSITAMLNVPIKFLTTGEKAPQLSKFYPDRIASRIMGMGDLLSLQESASNAIDEKSAKKGFLKMLSGQFDLEDLIQQMRQIRKIGSFTNILAMMPQTMNLSNQKIEQVELQMARWEVMISSMTQKERREPKLFKRQPNRRIRVIKGSGAKPDEFNKMLKKWEESKATFENIAKKIKSGQNPFGRNFTF